jgi:hypothetical protein
MARARVRAVCSTRALANACTECRIPTPTPPLCYQFNFSLQRQTREAQKAAHNRVVEREERERRDLLLATSSTSKSTTSASPTTAPSSTSSPSSTAAAAAAAAVRHRHALRSAELVSMSLEQSLSRLVVEAERSASALAALRMWRITTITNTD